MAEIKWVERGGLKFLEFEALEQSGDVLCVFTTRWGGVSSGRFANLNLGLHVGDRRENVVENRRRVGEALGIDYESLVVGRQVHGAQVAVVGPDECGKGALRDADTLEGVDGLVTAYPNIPLAVVVADCLPIFAYDPVHKVVGIAHAGWRGTLSKIAKALIRTMWDRFSTSPWDVLVALGPCVGVCCYNVGEDVANRFAAGFASTAPWLSAHVNGGWALDLREANICQLVSIGVRRENIFSAEHCTACNTDIFFSHRGEGAPTGRMTGIIMLR